MATTGGRIVPYQTPNKLELRALQTALDNIRESLGRIDSQLTGTSKLAGQTALTSGQGAAKTAALQQQVFNLQADLDALAKLVADEAAAPTPEHLVVLFGDDVADGEDGPPGPRGRDGTIGINGRPGVSLFIDGDDGEDGFPIPGRAGTAGTNGIDGVAGRSGVSIFLDPEEADDGIPIPGRPGTNGTNGIDGARGPIGISFGVDGDDGEDGQFVGFGRTLGSMAFLSDTLFVRKAGDTMTGPLLNTQNEALRIVANSAFVSGYESTNTTRTGYLQFAAGSQALLRAEGGTNLTLQTDNGSFSILGSTGIAAVSTRLGIGKTAGAVTDVLDVVSAGRAYLVLTSGGASTTAGISLSATAGPSAWTIDAGIGSAHSLRIYDGTNAAERLRIDSTGQLGIGAAPTATSGRLQVIGVGSPDSSVRISNTTYGVNLRLAASTGVTDSAVIYTEGAHALRFGTNNTENVRIDSAGNVGINSTAPQNYGVNYATLEVKGGTTSTGGVIQSVSSDSSVKLRLFVDSGLGIVGTSSASALLFQTNGVERARFDTSGQFGIGTNLPGFTLDVQAAAAKIVAKSTTGTNIAYLRTDNTGGSFYLGQDSSVGSITGTAYATMVWGVASTGGMLGGATSAVRMRIDTSGNVGIGMTPSGKFDVSGVVRAMRASTATTGSGVELELTGGTGYVTAYNRTGAAFLPLIVRGSTLTFNIGATARIAVAAAGTVTLSAGLGINGKAAVANVAAPPAATVLADTITLVNDIRTRLINFGIYT